MVKLGRLLSESCLVPRRSAKRRAAALAAYLKRAQAAVTFPNPISFPTQYLCGDQYNGCQLGQVRVMVSVDSAILAAVKQRCDSIPMRSQDVECNVLEVSCLCR